MPPVVTNNPQREPVGDINHVLGWLRQHWMMDIYELPVGERGKIYDSPLAVVFKEHGWDYVRMGSRTMTLGMGNIRTAKIELPWFVRQYIRAFDKGWAHDQLDREELTDEEYREAEAEYAESNISADLNYRLVRAINGIVTGPIPERVA